MRALRYHGQKDIRLETVDEPSKVKPGWVKVRPGFVGICGTDLHEYLGGHSLIPRPGHAHVLTHETSPVILGHEFSGIIEEVGEGVTDLEPGHRVCVQPTLYCGDCHACKTDLPNCCDKNGFLGLSGWGGGLCDVTVAPRSAIWKLPESMTLELGALVEPLAVGWHAVSISPIPHPIPSNITILVLGGGPIGLSVIQVVLAQSESSSKPPTIIVSEPSPARQQFSKEFGANHVINPLESDLVGLVYELTNGRGVDIAIDCAGVQSGLDEAIKCLRPRGTVVNVAVWENRASLDMTDFLFRERGYIGIATYSNQDFGHVIRAIDEGRLVPGRMVTKIVRLDDVVDDGFLTLLREKDTQVKVLVEVGGENVGVKTT